MSTITSTSTPAGASAGTGERTSTSRGFRPDIQGLRAIAVLLVLVYHAGVVFVPGGYIGVDVFFVVSGFLITGHLLSQLERRSKISFADFYARRVRRILPASMVVLGLTVVASLFWVAPLQRETVLQDALATALYVPNYWFAVEGTNYLATTTPSMFQHYWSLGIEEQFYLFWPAILAVGFLLARRSRRGLFVLMIVLVVASFAFSVWLLGQSQPWAFFSLPSRAWELGVGGLLAFLLTKGARWVRGPFVAILGWAGLAGLLVLAAVYNDTTVFPGVNALLPVLAAAALIAGCTARHAWSPARLLSLRPMLWLGMISYSLYLVHWPMLQLAQAALGLNEPLHPEVKLAIAFAAIPVAHFLYVTVENPARTADFWANARPRRSLLIGLVASVAVLALSACSLVLTSNTSLSTNKAAAPSSGAGLLPKGTAYVPSNLKPTLQGAADDNPAIYANGCHRDFGSTDPSGCLVGTNQAAPVVALFGDSHAAQWYPALAAMADAGQIRLDVNTKSSCPSVTLSVLRDDAPYTECTTWRAGVIKRLTAQPPALVVLANYGRADLGADNTRFASAWSKGLQTTIRALSPSKVAVFSDTPDMGTPPSVCLSSHLKDAAACARPAVEAINKEVRTVEQAAKGATYVDFVGYFCDTTCPAVIGSTLVYRDSHHMTATFSAGLSKVVDAQVTKLLPAS
ncbi:acyltransferase family protein [Leifsonia sp. NPDC058230]|uniref:acyltransferase family protein n=1 Tax=Leifsonia sp. NPDC058230 TaxID=3346391 RepID=UPI0036DD62D0